MMFFKSLFGNVRAPLKIETPPVLNFNKGLAAWIGYFIPTPDQELGKEILNDFLSYVSKRFSESNTKERINSKLEEVYAKNPLKAKLTTDSKGIEASIFDSDYFMEDGSIGYDRGPLMGVKKDYTPNIVFSNIRSKNVHNLVSPISIFPNTSYDERDYTKIYLLHEFQGPINQDNALAICDWTKNISKEMYLVITEEYVRIFNDFLTEMCTPKLVKTESHGYINMPDGSKFEFTKDGKVDDGLVRKAEELYKQMK